MKHCITIGKDCYMKGYKIELYPTLEQSKFIDRCIELNRYIYNWALEQEKNQYELFKEGKTDKKFITEYELSRIFTKFRSENSWITGAPTAVMRNGIHKLVDAFTRFFKGQNGYPKFKTKKNNYFSFGTRSERMYFEDNLLRIEGLPKGDKIFTKCHTGLTMKSDISFYNSIISKDNLGRYFVSFSLITPKKLSYFEDKNIPKLNRAIGIDLNVKKRFVLSNGDIFYAPDTRKIQKQISLLQRRHKKDVKRSKMERTNPEKDIQLSKRATKRLNKLRYKYKKLHNINENFIQTTTKKIIDMNPSAVVMENLDVSRMMRKAHDISSRVYFACFYRSRRVMGYKCDNYNIPFILAPKDYKSTQLCNVCGHEKKMHHYKTYKCPICGNIEDRDINAAINLEKLAYT